MLKDHTGCDLHGYTLGSLLFNSSVLYIYICSCFNCSCCLFVCLGFVYIIVVTMADYIHQICASGYPGLLKYCCTYDIYQHTPCLVAIVKNVENTKTDVTSYVEQNNAIKIELKEKDLPCKIYFFYSLLWYVC